MKNDAVSLQRANGSARTCVAIADPDERLQNAYRTALAERGIEAVAALSGVECVAQMRDRVPDALVLEPRLPWGGGDGVLAIMNEAPQLAHVPVMVVTSGLDPDDLNSVWRFPVFSYQLKPLAPQLLVEKLRMMLQARRSVVGTAERTHRMEMSIAKRTMGQVRDLRVHAVDGRIIVSGRANSYYVKQLAIAAVREAFVASEAQASRIAVSIEVQRFD